MKQIYNSYSAQDQDVWKILFERQSVNLQSKACDEYLACLKKLEPVLHAARIPIFEDLNSALSDANGWSIEVVPGLKPVIEFFRLLSERKFCSSTWLRSPEQLDYLEEPDMFHDIFGHIPLFMNKDFADFTQSLGMLGLKYADDQSIIDQLQRLYWYTVEFGVISRNGQTQIYGAGIASSFSETNNIYLRNIEIEPFDLHKVMNDDFIITEIQSKYYALNALTDLYSITANLDHHLLKSKQISHLI